MQQTAEKTTATASPAPAEDRSQRRGAAILAGNAQRLALVAIWAAVAIAFSVARPESFATATNFQTIFGSQAVLLVLALGLIPPLLCGDFDLSVASLVGLSAVVIAKLNVDQGAPIVAAIVVAIAVGGIVGLVNGLLTVRLGINSFIVTLGVGTFLTGLTAWASSSQTISGVSPDLVTWVVTNRLLGISLAFWYGLALCVAMWLILQFTPLGARLLFVGRNRSVSRLSGLHVDRLRIGAFVTAGIVAALAGVIYIGTQGGVDPTAGQNFLLPAFAACFLGATTITPGRFNAWGTFVAVYFLVTGITGLQILGATDFVQNLFYGGALVLAVAASRLVQRRRDPTDEGV